MKRTLNKFQVGDKVVISKMFKANPFGYMEDCEPIICEIQSFDLTSMGPNYRLYNKNVKLHICYWEDDIDYKIDNVGSKQHGAANEV
jgi:hypothetical protein